MDTEEFLLCGETQYVDLGFGTQEEPLVEEEDQLIQGSDGLDTQVLDRFDEEAVVVADSDDDDATVFLEDSSEREISDSGDSHCRGANLLLSENKARELPNENIKSTELILCRDMESLERWLGLLMFVQRLFVLLLVLQAKSFSTVTVLLYPTLFRLVKELNKVPF
ncbi:Uncharacterized protein Rs2_37947 [Raphanus sativus]|nr:Uncharacterized protein Rs2_37947 [Raphanus sativus]